MPEFNQQMPIHSLAVFCGSKSGNNPLYTKHAEELGNLLAIQKITLIYGGGGKGIMKPLADAAMAGGGKVTGVITTQLLDWEHQHKGITELTVVNDMHTRKKTMYDLCDAAMVLPGGLGTLDEFFEMLTWNQLAIHDKRIFILNSAGFFDHLLAHINKLEMEGFLYESAKERITVLANPQQLLQHL